MKQLKYIIVGVICTTIICSCSKWLTVSPKTEMSQKDLFKTESGFNDAIIGVYILLKSNSLYGQNMTMSTVEHLVSHWDTEANSAAQNFSLHSYTNSDCEATIETIYGQFYRAIATLNVILENVDEAKNNGVFVTPGSYELVKGECLALRALCHFDILRLFGPVPALADNSNILPYVTVLSKLPHAQTNYFDFCKLTLKDLSDASVLLKEKYLLLSAPYLRMNYYAVKALQARAYLYMGELNEAYNSAKEVVTAKDETAKLYFNLGTLGDITTNEDYTLKSEHIFALHDYKLYQTYEGLFIGGSLKRGKNHDAIKSELFGGEAASDIRANLWFTAFKNSGDPHGTIKKYFSEKSESGFADTRIPILRLSEMFLILCETAPLSEAQTYWDTYRKTRSIQFTTLNEETRQTEIMNEYRKEFFAEGVMFFFHKRVNSPKSDIKWSSQNSSMQVNYVWPLPKKELSN